jgi:hypothetical protein
MLEPGDHRQELGQLVIGQAGHQVPLEPVQLRHQAARNRTAFRRDGDQPLPGVDLATSALDQAELPEPLTLSTFWGNELVVNTWSRLPASWLPCSAAPSPSRPSAPMNVTAFNESCYRGRARHFAPRDARPTLPGVGSGCTSG